MKPDFSSTITGYGDSGGPHVGPMNYAIWDVYPEHYGEYWPRYNDTVPYFVSQSKMIQLINFNPSMSK